MSPLSWSMLLCCALVMRSRPLQIDRRFRRCAQWACFPRRIDVSQIINRYAEPLDIRAGKLEVDVIFADTVMLKMVPWLSMLTLSPMLELALACSAVVLVWFLGKGSANCSSKLTVDCAGAFFEAVSFS